MKNFLKNIKARHYLFLLLLVIAWLSFSGEFNLYKLWRLEQKKDRTAEEIERTEIEKQRLQLEIERLKYDTTYIEEKARVDYGMTKPGEKVYIFESEKGNE